MTKTKKVGSSGKFGPRYGRKAKLRYAIIDKSAKAKYECPDCKAIKVKRESSGIWKCSNCGLKFAAGAYTPMVSIDKLLEEKLGAAKKIEEAEKEASEPKAKQVLKE